MLKNKLKLSIDFNACLNHFYIFSFEKGMQIGQLEWEDYIENGFFVIQNQMIYLLLLQYLPFKFRQNNK